MIPAQLKKSLSTGLIILLIASQFTVVATYLLTPKPAKAFLGIADLTFGITIQDIVAAAEKISAGVIERLAVSYANKYLTKFVQQISDKYRIKDVLFYNQYLSNYYISNAILKNVSDPNLRQALNLTTSLYVTGQYTAFCNINGSSGSTLNSQAACTAAGGTWKDPRTALLPLLNTAVAQVYAQNGGIDPSKVYNPDPNQSDVQYFSMAQTYLNNPIGFTQQSLNSQYGAFQSSATTASQLEVLVGNGLKAGRIIGGTCSSIGDTTNTPWPNGTNAGGNWDPVTCAANGGQWNQSALDQARNFITNPASFVDKYIDKGVNQILGNNFNPTNIYVQIGQAIGSFLFTQLDLNTSGGSTSTSTPLSDGGSYNPNTTGLPSTTVKTIDLDGDGIPDVQVNGNNSTTVVQVGDTCYNGLVNPNQDPTTAPVCIASKDPRAAGSTYFEPFCTSIGQAISDLEAWIQFQIDHKYQIQGGSYNGSGLFSTGWFSQKDQTDFTNDADAQSWAEHGTVSENSIHQLITALEGLNSTNPAVDSDIVQLNRFYVYMDDIDNRLYGHNDTDHIGNWPDGFRTLLNYSEATDTFLKAIRGTVVNCAVPDVSPVAPLVEPTGPAQLTCSQQGMDEQNFALPLLLAGDSPNSVVSQINSHFGLNPSNEAGYDPSTNSILLPEFTINGPNSLPNSPTTWTVVSTCTPNGDVGKTPSDCSPPPTAAQTAEAQAAINLMLPLLNAITPMDTIVSPPPQAYQDQVQAIIAQANAQYPGVAGLYYPADNVIGMAFNYIVGPADHQVSNQVHEPVSEWTNAWRVTCAVGAAPSPLAEGGAPYSFPWGYGDGWNLTQTPASNLVRAALDQGLT